MREDMVSAPGHLSGKKWFLLRLSSVCCFFFAAAVAASAQISISVTALDELAFGTFAAGTGGTLTIETDANRIVVGLVDFAAAPGGGVATFEVQGEPSTAYAISLASPVTLSRSTGSETMTIGEFVTDPDGAGFLDGAGHQIISVGATLHVAAAQRPGAYSGSLDITVDYQ